jgi:hypothetical protein
MPSFGPWESRRQLSAGAGVGVIRVLKDYRGLDIFNHLRGEGFEALN